MLVIMCTLVFVKIIKLRQREYVIDFKQRQLCMSDFTLMMSNLPMDDEILLSEKKNLHFEEDMDKSNKSNIQTLLKAKLWYHFRDLFEGEVSNVLPVQVDKAG